MLVGDSTMQARTGYGDAFCALFKPGVECLNLGRGGRSTKSYRADGSWDRVLAAIRDNPRGRATYVLLQLGHNDQPGKAERSTDLETEYPANLRRYIEELRHEGARPVIVSPLTRRTFGEDGRLREDLAPWANAARAVAAETGAPFIDLHAASVASVSRMGQAEADTLAMAPAPSKDFDRTHLGAKGASHFAKMLADLVAPAVPAIGGEFIAGTVAAAAPPRRPTMSAREARGYSLREVLGPWDPLAQRATPADFVVGRDGEVNGKRHFRSVQQAVNAALRLGAEAPHKRVRIAIGPGTYRELVYIPASAPPITLVGEGADPSAVRIRATLDARVTGARYAETFGADFDGAPPGVAAMFASLRSREAIGTPGSAAVWVRSRGFEAMNLTIENGHNQGRGDIANHSQAVALLLDDADEAHLDQVRLIGFQDTFFLAATSPTHPARAFVHRSYVEGDMDFIFGEATAYFLETEVRTLGDRAVSYALAPSTHYLSRHGFVFERCRFTHDGSRNALAGTFRLGRQWYRSPAAVGKVAILDSEIGAHIDAARPWADWGIGTPRYRPVLYDSGDVLEPGDLPKKSPPEPFLVEYNNAPAR